VTLFRPIEVLMAQVKSTAGSLLGYRNIPTELRDNHAEWRTLLQLNEAQIVIEQWRSQIGLSLNSSVLLGYMD
jgi:hypothetical protein